MGAKLAVERGASHTKEYAQLLLDLAVSHSNPLFRLSTTVHLHSNWPNLYDSTVSILAN